jgi:hypothetical protein
MEAVFSAFQGGPLRPSVGGVWTAGTGPYPRSAVSPSRHPSSPTSPSRGFRRACTHQAMPSEGAGRDNVGEESYFSSWHIPLLAPTLLEGLALPFRGDLPCVANPKVGASPISKTGSRAKHPAPLPLPPLSPIPLAFVLPSLLFPSDLSPPLHFCFAHVPTQTAQESMQSQRDIAPSPSHTRH